jgi:bacterioferritin-associated ferredoxin
MRSVNIGNLALSLAVNVNQIRIVRICDKLRFSIRLTRYSLHKMIVCICHGINEKAIRIAVAEGASSPSDIAGKTGAGTCCGKCHDCVREILDDELGRLTPIAA